MSAVEDAAFPCRLTECAHLRSAAMMETAFVMAFGGVLIVWAVLRIVAGERQRRIDEIIRHIEQEEEEARQAAQAAASASSGRGKSSGRLAA